MWFRLEHYTGHVLPRTTYQPGSFSTLPLFRICCAWRWGAYKLQRRKQISRSQRASAIIGCFGSFGCRPTIVTWERSSAQPATFPSSTSTCTTGANLCSYLHTDGTSDWNTRISRCSHIQKLNISLPHYPEYTHYSISSFFFMYLRTAFSLSLRTRALQ